MSVLAQDGADEMGENLDDAKVKVARSDRSVVRFTQPLSDDYIVRQSVEDLSDHLIITIECNGANFQFLQILEPLRAQCLEKHRPIVILARDVAAVMTNRAIIGRLPNVFVLEGSALVPRDLYRAGISRAYGIAVTGEVGRFNSLLTDSSSVMVADADAIFAFNNIKDIAAKVNPRFVVFSSIF